MDFLMKVCNVQNAVTLHQLADKHQNENLKIKSNTIIWKSYSQVRDEFNKLPQKDVESIIFLKNTEYVRNIHFSVYIQYLSESVLGREEYVSNRIGSHIFTCGLSFLVHQ